jgi:hypothetical protein
VAPAIAASVSPPVAAAITVIIGGMASAIAATVVVSIIFMIMGHGHEAMGQYQADEEDEETLHG